MLQISSYLYLVSLLTVIQVFRENTVWVREVYHYINQAFENKQAQNVKTQEIHSYIQGVQTQTRQK